MISKVGSQQNNPNFKGLFKLNDPRLWTKDGKPTELYQVFVETIQYRFGFYNDRADFFTCDKQSDSAIQLALHEMNIKFLHKDDSLYSFPGDTFEQKAVNAYNSFASGS